MFYITLSKNKNEFKATCGCITKISFNNSQEALDLMKKHLTIICGANNNSFKIIDKSGN